MSKIPLPLAALTLLLGLAGCSDSPVSLPEATTLAMAGESLNLLVGETAAVGVQVLDQQGRVMPGSQPVFASDDASVATVDAAGMVRGVSPGQTKVKAMYGGLTGAVTVTVGTDRRTWVRSLSLAVDSLVADTRAGVQPVMLQAFDGLGQPVCPEVIVQSTDVVVATARPAGMCRIEVVPAFPGEAGIIVLTGDVADTLRVRVTSTGAVAFFSGRPRPEKIVAGATVRYTVRAIDQTGAPIAGLRVSFSTTVGALSATSVLTDAQGDATVRWQIPTDLRQLGQNQQISFRTQLPNGPITGRTETVFVNGASLVTLLLYANAGGTGWVTVTGPIVWNRWYSNYIGARGFDQYGNVRRTPVSFSHTSTSHLYRDGPYVSGDMTYVRLYSSYTATAVVTATAPGGLSRSVQITFR